jgi:hypothetical protein
LKRRREPKKRIGLTDEQVQACRTVKRVLSDAAALGISFRIDDGKLIAYHTEELKQCMNYKIGEI